MKLYVAIDLHSNNNVTVLIDEQDQVVYQRSILAPQHVLKAALDRRRLKSASNEPQP